MSDIERQIAKGLLTRDQAAAMQKGEPAAPVAASRAPARTAVLGYFAGGEQAICWREPIAGPTNRWWLGVPDDGIVRKPLPFAPEKAAPLTADSAAA